MDTLRPVLLERSAIAHLGRSEEPAWPSPYIPLDTADRPAGAATQPRQSIDGISHSSIGQRVLQLLADQMTPEVANWPARLSTPGDPLFRGWDPIDDPCCLFCSNDQHFRKFRTFGRSIPLRRMRKLPLNVVSTTAGERVAQEYLFAGAALEAATSSLT